MFTECPFGSYGPDCVYNCSRNCLGDVACNRRTGKCDTGCDFGYTGELCETGLMKLKILKYAFVVDFFSVWNMWYTVLQLCIGSIIRLSFTDI